MIKRIISAAILIPLVVWLILFANPLYFSVFTMVTSIIAYLEWVTLNPKTGNGLKILYSLLSALFVFIFIFHKNLILYTIFFVFITHMIINLSALSKDRLLDTYYLFGGIFYVSLYVFLILIMRLPQGRILLMLLFVSIWSGDTFAYFCGRAIGKTRLAPRISPKKTTEGAICGVIFGVLFAALFGYLFKIPTAQALLIGLVANITGILGDLAESAIKRAFNKKDSSNLIPGHGGVLDRLDSVAFAGFFVYIVVLWKIL